MHVVHDMVFTPRWKKDRKIMLSIDHPKSDSFRIIRINKKSIRVKWSNEYFSHETIECDTSQFDDYDKKRMFYREKSI